MFHHPIARGQPFAGFIGLVVERSHPAAVGDVAALINDVNAFGPRSICVVGGVAHIVNSEGQGELESLREIIRDGHALLQCFRLSIANVVLHIGFHLPFVGGMRFTNVNGKEIGASGASLPTFNVPRCMCGRAYRTIPYTSFGLPAMKDSTVKAAMNSTPKIPAVHFQKRFMQSRSSP